MRLVLAGLALRNVVRHRLRSLSIGISIALATAALFLAGSFSHGIASVLYDKILMHVSGHVTVFASESGSIQRQVFRDGKWLREALSRTPGVSRVEERIEVLAQVFGGGGTDKVVLIGVDTGERNLAAQSDGFRMVEGAGWGHLASSASGFPVAISSDRAKSLGVGLGDRVRIRFIDLHGSHQVAFATVDGIYEAENPFLQIPMFMGMSALRGLMGYAPGESGGFDLFLDDPGRDAGPVEDEVRRMLRPRTASIPAGCAGHPMFLCGSRSDSGSRPGWSEALDAPGSPHAGPAAAIVPAWFARMLGLSVGDDFDVKRPRRDRGDSARSTLRVAAVSPEGGLPDSAIVLGARSFRLLRGDDPPRRDRGRSIPESPGLVPEWTLLPRVANKAEYDRQMAEIQLAGDASPTVGVYSMRATASDVVDLAEAISVLAGTSIALLFAVALIGVRNSIRSMVLERAREIGTLRAIGLQSRQVVQLLALEAAWLAAASAAAGLALGFALMRLIGSVPLEVREHPLGMLLVRQRIVFSPTWGISIGVPVLVAGLSLAAMLGSALRTARLSPAEALRRHE